MTPLALLAAAALLAGPQSAFFGPIPAGTGDVSVRAGQAVRRGEDGPWELSGGVVLQRGAVVLRARSATVDPRTGEVQATGDVLLVDATRVLAADGVRAVLDGPFQATGVVGFEKGAPLRLEEATTLEAARRGRNRISFTAAEVDGDADGRLRLRLARFTLCDCGPGEPPSWELGASRAEAEGDRVALRWPVFYVTPRALGVRRPVPVLVLPWLSLPLRDRQSGLLFPEVGSNGRVGPYLRQPLYLTLGRSADATLAPEAFLGPRDHGHANGAVRGPGLWGELRWAPAERAAGQLQAHLVNDVDRERIHGWRLDGAGAATASPQPGGRGLRLSLEGAHAQDLGEGTRLTAQLALSQDPFMFRDFKGAGMPGDATYARSAALVSRAREAWVLEGSAAYLEPLVSVDRGDWSGTWRPGRFGWFGLQAPATQRWPSLAAALLPEPLGPLAVEGRAGLSRFATAQGGRGELLPTDRAYHALIAEVSPGAPAIDQAALDASSRAAVTRGDLRLQLSAPLLIGRAVGATPFVRGALVGYAPDAGGSSAAAWAAAGLDASAELARDYGPLEHRIVPGLQLLGGTAAGWSRRSAAPAYDLWDRPAAHRAGEAAPVQTLAAAPEGAYAQLRASLENRLDAGPAGRAALQLGQDLDLRSGEPAESFASLSAARGWVSGDARARILLFGGEPALPAGYRRSWLDPFTQLHLGAAVRNGRGDALTAALDATGPGAVGAQGAGVDALFDLRSNGSGPDASCSLGARLVWGGASLDYRLKLAARYLPYASADSSGAVARSAGQVLEQEATLTWDSPCHCFLARAGVKANAKGEVDRVLVEVDLSKALQRVGEGVAQKTAAPQ